MTDLKGKKKMRIKELITEKSLKRTMRNVGLTALGTLILAIGVGGFIMPTGLVMGGVSGAACGISAAIFFGFLSPLSGTGSYPPWQKGLQRRSLHTVRMKPTKKPRFLNASMA